MDEDDWFERDPDGGDGRFEEDFASAFEASGTTEESEADTRRRPPRIWTRSNSLTASTPSGVNSPG